MDADKIKEFIGEYGDDHFPYGEHSKDLTLEGYTVKCVGSYGGEDCGSEYWKVFEISQPGEESQFWRVEGWYQSHYGAEVDWDEAFRVESYTRVIRDWKPYGEEGEPNEE